VRLSFKELLYFTLVKHMAEFLIDHLPNPSSDEDRVMQLTRRTSAEVYAFIESDLTDAIAALPNKSVYAASEKGRASKEAYALLAKVNLYQNGKSSRQR
jgi:hypothetical protein